MSTNNIKNNIPNIKNNYINQPLSNNNTILNINKETKTDNLKLIIGIKNHVSSNLKYWLLFVIPVLILLFYLLYQYNLGTRSNYVISNMNYKTKLENKPLLQCYQQDIKYQFKLCDYYINSSFMTPCVGNQHYDYVSNNW